MKRDLNIGKNFTLPIELVTSTQAILARKRSGKSYTASVQAEEMLAAGQQVAVIDPTGAWYGLKSSADGQGPGFPIVVFGGEHSDVPLEAGAGSLLARAMVERGFSAIFDVSIMGVAEAIRFVTAFCNQLFELNREAMHLFIDEADSYAPEKPFGDETKSLHAMKRLVKQGGIRGIGVTMITQRPQQLAKSILSQVDILTVLRMSHPLDLKAATDWISTEVTPQFAADVKLALPSLPVGTAFVCSAPLHIGTRVEVRTRSTFNSGATPKPGEKRVLPKVLAHVDLQKLGAEIQATVERAKADDPKELRARIAELERQIKAAPSVNPVNLIPDPKQLQDIRDDLLIMSNNHAEKVGAFVAKQLRDVAAGITGQVEELCATFSSPTWKADRLPASTEQALKEVRLVPKPASHASPRPASVARWADGVQTIAKREPAPKKAVSVPTMVHLTGPEIRILNAIAWLESIGVNQPEQPAVAFLAGYTYGAGSYNNARGQLNQASLVEYVPGGRIQLTDLGRTQAEAPEAPGSNEELHQRIMAKLPGPEQRLLAPLLKAWPHSLHNETLAEKSGYTHGAGSFNNARGRLRSLGLIEYPQPGACVARDLLFPLGR